MSYDVQLLVVLGFFVGALIMIHVVIPRVVKVIRWLVRG